MTLFEPVLAALDAADVRFVVVGGPLPFDELWDQAAVVHLEGQAVRIASVDHLITMKEAAGRPQDLADVAALEALRG